MASTDTVGDISSITIPLRSRRAERAARLAPLRDGVAAIALAWAALPRFRSGAAGEIALAAADVLVALALVVAIVRENTRSSDAHGHGDSIAWTDVAAGVMLFVEAYHQHVEGRPGRLLPYATVLIAVLTLAKGFAHDWFRGRTGRRRVLRLDGDGMYFGWSRLHRVRVPRREIASIETTDRAILVRGPSGATRTVSLRDAVEPSRVVDVVRAWAEAEGIPVDGK